MSAVAEVIQTTAVERIDPNSRAVMTPMAMLTQAVANGASIEVMEKLMALNERYEANMARKAFDAAMADAKAEMPTISKNRTVDFTSQKGRTNYRHEDLGEIAKTVDPILAKHGLSYRFRTETTGGNVKVICMVSHRDGHSEQNELTAGHDQSGNKNSIQAVGSTITYLQRYTLKAALGLAASNDDDGKRAETPPADLEPLSVEKMKQLRDLIDEVGADVEKFCAYMKVEALVDIPTGQFQRAVAALEAKRVKS